MDMGLWLAFIAATGALLLLPGPDWAFMLATGARQPRIVPPVAGLTIGYVILSLVVATGLGPLIAAVPAALITVTLAGAGTWPSWGSASCARRARPHPMPRRVRSRSSPARR